MNHRLQFVMFTACSIVSLLILDTLFCSLFLALQIPNFILKEADFWLPFKPAISTYFIIPFTYSRIPTFFNVCLHRTKCFECNNCKRSIFFCWHLLETKIVSGKDKNCKFQQMTNDEGTGDISVYLAKNGTFRESTPHLDIMEWQTCSQFTQKRLILEKNWEEKDCTSCLC